MLRFALRRLLLIIPTVWVVLTVVFVLVRVAPGDPAMAILGQNATQESLESLREQMGLKDPLWLQYVLFLGNLVRGDLGVSMLNSIPVKNQLLTALPYTLELTLSSMVVGVILGLPLGVVTALRRNRWADYVGRVVSLTGISIPSFYLGILLIFIFLREIGPFSGDGHEQVRRSLWEDPSPNFACLLHGINPYLLYHAGRTLHHAEHIERGLYPDSKGQGPQGRHRRLQARPSKCPHSHYFISVTSIYFIIILGASVMVEIVFSRPGLGKLMVLAMKQRDYVMLQSIMAIYSALAILINFVTDLVYGFVDPRIKLN
jgi:ABC-type dipeptide/oligopeptide/nickel transport system permease component